MSTVILKNTMNRPRVFSMVNADGEMDSIRFKCRQSQEVDIRLLTPEMVTNIQEGHILLMEGKIPKQLNPYLEKEVEKDRPKAPRKDKQKRDAPATKEPRAVPNKVKAEGTVNDG